jgi:hypothetical protein
MGAQVLAAERGITVGELGYNRARTLALAHTSTWCTWSA